MRPPGVAAEPFSWEKKCDGSSRALRAPPRCQGALGSNHPASPPGPEQRQQNFGSAQKVRKRAGVQELVESRVGDPNVVYRAKGKSCAGTRLREGGLRLGGLSGPLKTRLLQNQPVCEVSALQEVSRCRDVQNQGIPSLNPHGTDPSDAQWPGHKQLTSCSFFWVG